MSMIVLILQIQFWPCVQCDNSSRRDLMNYTTHIVACNENHEYIGRLTIPHEIPVASIVFHPVECHKVWALSLVTFFIHFVLSASSLSLSLSAHGDNEAFVLVMIELRRKRLFIQEEAQTLRIRKKTISVVAFDSILQSKHGL